MADLALTNAPASQMSRFEARAGSKVRIEGTSTIHDWQVEGALIGGYLEAGAGFPTEPGQAVRSGKVEARVEAFIPVRGLKSVEKNGQRYSDSMDGIMYEKLLGADNPKARITYRVTELVLTGVATSKESPYMFDSKGELVVAGVTNVISMPVKVLPLGDNKLRVSGSTSVKMTDFGIKPPEPKIIPIKTGDEVKLLFEWVVGRKAPVEEATAK